MKKRNATKDHDHNQGTKDQRRAHSRHLRGSGTLSTLEDGTLVVQELTPEIEVAIKAESARRQREYYGAEVYDPLAAYWKERDTSTE